MAESSGWKRGDRVVVALPDRNRRRGPWGSVRSVDVAGTVEDVDPARPPGLDPHVLLSSPIKGVVVRLDREVNGSTSCFATHAELRRAEP